MEIKIEWLVCQKTPEQFEREALERKASAFSIPLEKVMQRFADRPFGNMTNKWNELVSKMQEGDELWFFSTPEQMHKNKLGRNGYAILRDSKVIETLTMLRT